MTDNDKNVDVDSVETKEWLDALTSVIQYEGKDRAQFLVNQLLDKARQDGLAIQAGISTPYVNTIPAEKEAKLPDDPALIEAVTNCLRWNAIAMVLKTAKKKPELGGHLASYASIATLFEVGLQYFFKASSAGQDGDLIFYQGHASPGLYARAFLEGRLEAEHLDHFRQEVFNPKSCFILSTSLVNARFLAVSDGFDGLGAHQWRFIKHTFLNI